MPESSLIFDDGSPPETPGTHAVIIGCGSYRHLPGGSKPLLSGPLVNTLRDLDQLDDKASPSARHIADWIFETYLGDVGRPLRSVNFVLSEKVPQPYRTRDGVDHQLPEATFEAIQAAVLDWKRRGHASAENLLILYFFGHGLASGNQTTLLAGNFGDNPDDPFATAIDFNGLHRGMDLCQARTQVYLIDACRMSNQNLMEIANNRVGQPIIAGILPITDNRLAPIYYGAISGQAGFARSGRPSFFAQSLTDAFLGASWQKSQGHWFVEAGFLGATMEMYLKRHKARFGTLPVQFSSDHTTSFELKRPAGEPIVPVDVIFLPAADIIDATLSCSKNGTFVEQRLPQSGTWELNLTSGTYEISAAHPRMPVAETQSVLAFPPGSEVLFRVS